MKNNQNKMQSRKGKTVWASERWIYTKQNNDQEVASLSPTWENLGGRKRMKKEGREDEMKGTDGEEEAGQRLGKEEEGRRKKAQDGEPCIINWREMSWSAGANRLSICSSVIPAAALILYSDFILNKETWLTLSLFPSTDSSIPSLKVHVCIL